MELYPDAVLVEEHPTHFPAIDGRESGYIGKNRMNKFYVKMNIKGPLAGILGDDADIYIARQLKKNGSGTIVDLDVIMRSAFSVGTYARNFFMTKRQVEDNWLPVQQRRSTRSARPAMQFAAPMSPVAYPRPPPPPMMQQQQQNPVARLLHDVADHY